MKRVTVEQVIEIHSALIAETGGLAGTRDMNLLDGSVNSPYHTFDGKKSLPYSSGNGRPLAFSLVKNHPFLDTKINAGKSMFNRINCK